MYTPIVDETTVALPATPRRRWYHTFALGVVGGAATAACVTLALCLINVYCPWMMSEPFDATLCLQNDANRMRGQPEDIGTREVGLWLSATCQHALSCGASPSLILDRPCTQEDKMAGARGAVRHIAPTVVSHHFRVVYVANPTSVDYLVRAVMHRYLMAEDGNSTEISTHMRLAYFFFSFVEHTQDRFFYAAEQLQVFNSSDSCAVMRDRMTSLTDLRAWVDVPRVYSQAFLLSAEAGSSNKMINYHWLGDATLVSHGIIDVLLRIQLHAELCLPVIDFKWLNFEVVHNNLAHSSAVRALQACGDAGLKKRVMDVYTQDSQCFGL